MLKTASLPGRIPQVAGQSQRALGLHDARPLVVFETAAAVQCRPVATTTLLARISM